MMEEFWVSATALLLVQACQIRNGPMAAVGSFMGDEQKSSVADETRSSAEVVQDVSPFINEDKIGFVVRRWVQSWLGGLQLLFAGDGSVSLWLHFLQWSLLLLPGLIVALFLLLAHGDTLDTFPCRLAAGGALLLIRILVLALSTPCMLSRITKVEALDLQGGFVKDTGLIDNEEEALDLEECVSAEVCRYILPPPKSVFELLWTCCALAALGVLSVGFLDIDRILEAFGDTSGAVVVACGCAVVSVTAYSLLAKPPIDPNQYQADGRNASQASRALHALGLMLADWICSDLATRSSYSSEPLIILYLTLPLIWSFAILPPPKALLEWITELILVFGLSGHHTMSLSHAAVQLLWSVLAVVAGAFVYDELGQTMLLAVVLGAAVLGGHCDWMSAKQWEHSRLFTAPDVVPHSFDQRLTDRPHQQAQKSVPQDAQPNSVAQPSMEAPLSPIPPKRTEKAEAVVSVAERADDAARGQEDRAQVGADWFSPPIDAHGLEDAEPHADSGGQEVEMDPWAIPQKPDDLDAKAQTENKRSTDVARGGGVGAGLNLDSDDDDDGSVSGISLPETATAVFVATKPKPSAGLATLPGAVDARDTEEPTKDTKSPLAGAGEQLGQSNGFHHEPELTESSDSNAEPSSVSSDRHGSYSKTRDYGLAVGRLLIAGAAVGCGLALHEAGYETISTDLSSFSSGDEYTGMAVAVGVLAVAQQLSAEVASIFPFCIFFCGSRSQASSRPGVYRALTLAFTVLTRVVALLTVIVLIGVPSKSTDAVERFGYSVLAYRAVRRCVYFNDSAIELALTLLLDELLGSWWTGITFTLRLALSQVILSRLIDCLHLLQFWLVHTTTCFTHKKLRMKHATKWLFIVVTLAPIHLMVIIVTAVLGGTLIPVLGSPLCVTGFPRPRRFWSDLQPLGIAGRTNSFYEAMTKSVAQRLPDMVSHGYGPLGHLSAGSAVIFRVEPFLLWMQVIDMSARRAMVVFRGLELQATSCHTVEASRIDEVVDESLTHPERISSVAPSRLSSGFSLRAVASLPTVSFNHASLVGVLDNADVLQSISTAFQRFLLLELHRRGLQTLPPSVLDESPVSDFDLAPLAAAYPSAFKVYLEKNEPSPAGDNSDANMKRLVLSAVAIVEVLGLGGMSVVRAGARHVCDVFAGHIPPSLYSVFLTQPRHHQLLRMVLRSYRYAVKAAYDALALMELQELQGDTAETWAKYVELHSEYGAWDIGPDTTHESSSQQSMHVATHGNNTFSVAANDDGTYRADVSSIQEQDVSVFTVNQRAVQSLWQSLSTELLYFANDDDERYSIQAHPLLLRNLIVQSAEPPLGYPVFSTGPVSVPLSAI